MSLKGIADKVCGGSDETQLKGEGESGKTSTEENGAQGDGGKGANESNVSEKSAKENKETGCSPVLEQESLPEHHLAPDNFAVKSPEDVADKICGGSDKPQLKEEGETGKTSPEQNGAQGDVGKGANERNVSKKDTKENKERSCLPAVAIFLALVIAGIAVAIYRYTNSPENDMKVDFVKAKEFEYGLEELRSSFINQTDRFWKILRSRGLAHLQKKDPSRPLVFLLAAPPAAHEWVDCFAIKLAEKLDPSHKTSHKTTLPRIDGEKEKENNPDETKKTIDDYLKKKFGAGHRIAVIHHLELLPPPSPLLFYSYCHDQNAPNKHVAFIFTVHMPVEPSPSLSPKEAERSVEKYLSGEVWAKVDKDAVAGLLIYIADTVVLMNGESSASAKTRCS